MDSGENRKRIWVVSGTLFIFGLVYNNVVSEMQKRGYDEGYTAIMVVFGVMGTLLGVAVIDFGAAILAGIAFCFNGLILHFDQTSLL